MASDAGPFYFAWVDAGESTFGPQHAREDEEILRFTRELVEGQFGRLTIDVRNPRVGPLAPDRKIWAWFSWQSDSDLVPLFFGRLIAVPTNIIGEVVTMTLVARPSDWVAQKTALAASLRVLPYYDEIFVDEKFHEDPDVVLEGYSATWHVDHLTHAVTISDHLIGEAGVIVFNEADAIYDSVDLQIDRPPLRAVTVNADIPWTQRSSNTIDMGSRTFVTYTGESLLNGWPKTGDSLAGGYYVVDAAASDDRRVGSIEPVNWSITWTNRQQKHRDGDVMSFSESFSGPTRSDGGGPDGGTEVSEYGENVIGDPATGTPASFSRTRIALMVPLWQVSTRLVLGIDAERDRKDTISLTVAADLQPVLHDHPDLATSISTKVMERRGSLESLKEASREEAQRTILSRIRAYFGL